MASTSALEKFYEGMGNVVLRDTNGNPSIFVRHPRVNSSYFDPILPDTPHPAFVCGEDIDDAVLIGKYLNNELTTHGTLYSLPNMNAKRTGTHQTIADEITKIAAFGHGARPMTIADRGLLVLMAHKFGDSGMKGSNCNQCDIRDVYTAWRLNRNISSSDIGKVFAYRGWAYKALAAHTTTNNTRPDKAPQYWERLDKRGATDFEIGDAVDNEYQRISLTGSGPVSFNMLCDPTLEADIIGCEGIYIIGCRIYHSEIQIIPNNRAALPGVDVSDSSDEWRAILPHANDAGCDMVTPGTTGTLHYCWKNSAVTIVGRMPESSELSDTSYRTTQFRDTVVETETVPIMPSLMYELGLAPIPGTTVTGQWGSMRFGANNICHLHAFSYPSPTENRSGIATFQEVKNWTETNTFTRSRVREIAVT